MAVWIELGQNLQPLHQSIFNIPIELIASQVNRLVEDDQGLELVLSVKLLRRSFYYVFYLIYNLLFNFEWNPIDLIGVQIFQNNITSPLELGLVEAVFHGQAHLFAHELLREAILA